MSTFRDDGAAALEWVARYLETVGDYPVLSRVEPGAIKAALPCIAARRTRAVRGSPSRSRRDPDAGDHALAEPASLRLFRDDRSRAGHPRGAPDRRPQPGRHPLACLAGAPGARGGDARLAAAAARPARGAARPHRGHRIVRLDHGTRRGSSREPRPEDRRLLGAHALLDREGGAAARARAQADSRRRRVRDPGGSARPHGRLRGRRHGRHHVVRGRRSDRRDRRQGHSRRRVAPRRCRLRRCRCGMSRAPASFRRLGAGRLDRHRTPTSGCSPRWTARPSSAGARTTCAVLSASCRSTCGWTRMSSA